MRRATFLVAVLVGGLLILAMAGTGRAQPADRVQLQLKCVTQAQFAGYHAAKVQVDASLQLSVYSYATSMNSLGDQEDLRPRFDVLTKTKQPACAAVYTEPLHPYTPRGCWPRRCSPSRTRASEATLFRRA